jgi:hypothetical protein
MNEFIARNGLIAQDSSTITGSLTVTQGISGSFSGSGANLFNIPASGITGLNLSQISSGSVSASISPNSGLQVNTNVTATSFTGSLFGTSSNATNAGNGFPFSGSAVITGSLLVFGSTTITGSLTATQGITGSLFGTSSFALSSSFATSASNALTASSAVTQTAGDNSNKIATTAFVSTAVAAGGVTVSGQDTFGTANIATVTAAQYAGFVTASIVSATTLYFITA